MNVISLVKEIETIKKAELENFCKRVKEYRGFVLYVNKQKKVWTIVGQKYINGRPFRVYVGINTNQYKFKIDNYISRKDL